MMHSRTLGKTEKLRKLNFGLCNATDWVRVLANLVSLLYARNDRGYWFFFIFLIFLISLIFHNFPTVIIFQ